LYHCSLCLFSKKHLQQIKTYIDFMLNQEEYFSDCVRHAEGGTVVLVRSTDQRVARSSPTQRKYFVCNYYFAGARPLDNIGAAAKFDNTGYNFSYTFNQDGSKSLSLGVNANIPIETPWVYLEINMGLGFSMNSYSGATLSTHGGLCVGYATACAGVETGGSLYWDRGGSFMGATVYAGVYASFGEGMARVSAGYEAGLFGMEGRGMYVGASAGVKGASLYASWAENGGFDYGGQAKASYKMINNGPKEKYVGFEVGIFDFLYDHDARNENQPNFNSIEEYEKYASDNDMLVGQYSKLQSKAHNPEKNVKMWMAKSKPISIFGILLTIPSIEGVFNKKTGKTDPGSASYNYGNNWITHGLLDVLSWLVMDEWFPNP
jgi:hypothetical protein